MLRNGVGLSSRPVLFSTVRTMDDLPPSMQQLRYLQQLRGPEPEEDWRTFRDQLRRDGRWTRREVSRLIEEAEQQPRAQPHRVNQYAGTCGSCGSTVLAGDGRVEKIDDRWVVFHPDCNSEPEWLMDGPPLGLHYVRGTTLDVRRSVAGRTYALVLHRGRFEADVNGEWMKLVTPGTLLTRETAIRHGQLTNVCAVCGRELKSDVSIERGIGPTCLAKLPSSEDAELHEEPNDGKKKVTGTAGSGAVAPDEDSTGQGPTEAGRPARSRSSA